MVAKTAMSIGDMRHESPKTPLKPYRSILALPLFSCAGQVIGCVSIDSSRPYYFQRLRPLVLESEIETNIGPYLADLALFLHTCGAREPAAMLATLKTGAEEVHGNLRTGGKSHDRG